MRVTPKNLFNDLCSIIDNSMKEVRGFGAVTRSSGQWKVKTDAGTEFTLKLTRHYPRKEKHEEDTTSSSPSANDHRD